MTENTELEVVKPTPIISPVLALLRSRKFIVALTAVISSVLVTQFPEIKEYIDLFVTVILTLAFFLIGGITLEDAAVKARKEAVAITPSIDDLRYNKEIFLDATLEELFELNPQLTEEQKAVFTELYYRVFKGQ